VSALFPWFISPWDVARLSWEAQRRMAFLLLRTDSSQEPCQKVIPDGGPSLRQVNEKNTAAAVGTAIPATFTTTKRSKRQHVRNVAGAIRKSIRVKGHTIEAKGTRSRKKLRTRSRP
jgi:hypothetical protein